MHAAASYGNLAENQKEDLSFARIVRCVGAHLAAANTWLQMPLHCSYASDAVLAVPFQLQSTHTYNYARMRKHGSIHIL